jgi:hypothetical protein
LRIAVFPRARLGQDRWNTTGTIWWDILVPVTTQDSCAVVGPVSRSTASGLFERVTASDGIEEESKLAGAGITAE